METSTTPISRTALIGSLFLLPAITTAATINVDVTNFSEPAMSPHISLKLNGVDVTYGSWIRSTHTLTLDDGRYRLSTGTGETFGDIVVSGDSVTTSGALINLNGAVTLDRSKLAAVSIDFSEVDWAAWGTIRTPSGGWESGEPWTEDSIQQRAVDNIAFGMPGISGYIIGSRTFYLPEGEYTVGLRGSNVYHGAIYGKVAVNGTDYSVKPYVYTDGSGLVRDYLLRGADGVHFNLATLPRVTIEEGEKLTYPPRGTLPGIPEVGGGNYIRMGSYTLHLPPSTYRITTRPGLAEYGQFTLGEDGSVTASGLLTTTDTPGTVAFDLDRTPRITMNFAELSETAPITWGGIYETVGAADNRSIYLPPAHYEVHSMAGRSNRYGEFDVVTGPDVPLDQAVSNVQGSLYADGNSVSFELCSLNAVVVTPADGVRYFNHEHFSSTEPNTLYLPSGTHRLNLVEANNSRTPLSFSVGPDGLQIVDDTGINGRLALAHLPTSCAPPDTDADGVLDDVDACPDTTAGTAIDADGCSIEQSIVSECASWQARSHGKYMRCVTQVVNRYADEDLIDVNTKGDYINEAAHQ